MWHSQIQIEDLKTCIVRIATWRAIVAFLDLWNGAEPYYDGDGRSTIRLWQDPVAENVVIYEADAGE